MRKLALAMALVIGFFVVAGRTHDGFRVVGVATAGTLTGFTLTLSDYAAVALMNRDGVDRLTADRHDLALVDWAGRITGFGLLAWLAWRRFGRAAPESERLG